MTVTVTTVGVNVANEALEALARELSRARQQSRDADPKDVDATLAALDRFAELVNGIDNARWQAAAATHDLIRRALKLGVDPRDIYDRPFSDTIIRRVVKELNMKMPRPGPRPRRRPGSDTAG